MLLSFQTSHASITSFPTVNLPDFSLITGPNGAGKTHLLQAIHQGAVRTDVAPNQSATHQVEARMFDWISMVPQDAGLFSSESLRNERTNVLNNYTSLRRHQPSWLEPAREVIRTYKLGERYLSDPALALDLGPEEIERLAPGQVQVFQIRLKQALDQFSNQILASLDPNFQTQIQEVSRHSKRHIAALRDADILSPAIPTWGRSEIFQQSFGRLFVAYRDLKLANLLAELKVSKGETAAFLTDEEFTREYGPAPWDFVNTSLMEGGLDFIIDRPPEFDYAPFQPTLTKCSTGTQIPFSSLSSGEKVLMSFAFCVYYSNDRRQLAVQPKVLLLDEIDAPLHPSMSKNIINTIVKVLVNSFDIKVIATTHSPSTVALAPEDSIFTMKSGVPGLHKNSKAAALNVLTVGVPTIAISYDGRRQVFVESPADADVYDRLYRLLKHRISSERSLEFIATGTRNLNGGDLNTGCEVVKRLVSTLARSGNLSIFGLIDWDGKNEHTDRIAVLAHGTRNGLENVLFDPLLIGLTILRDFSKHKGLIGVPDEISYIDFVSKHRARFQDIASVVTRIVTGNEAPATVISRYVGDFELNVDSSYYTMDDHALENRVLAAFDFFKGVASRAGGLFTHIISNVAADDPGLLPDEVRQVLEHLLNRPAHT